MIRYTLLALFIAFILVYSWKDWFRALCLLVVLVAVLERPDVHGSLLGVQGLNPFNIALVGILVAWAFSRSRPTLEWDAPRWFNVGLSLFAGVMLISFTRLFADPSSLVETGAGLIPLRYTTSGLVAEFFFNAFKWMIPGLLVFQGCRSREQHRWAVLCLVGLYVVLAGQTIKHMPLSLLLDGEALEQRAARVLTRDIGYFRVELAGVFAGGSWAMLAVRPLFSSRAIRLGLLGMSVATALALALTAGRAGYGAWCIVGVLMAGLRWRRALLLGPIAVALLLGYAPGVGERFLQGIDSDGRVDGGAIATQGTDLYTVTAGRSVLWPYVLRSIAQRPVFGYGREALSRNGLAEEVVRGTGEYFGHPHNGYLQFALDNGLVGLSIFLVFFGALLLKSVVLFRSGEPQATAAGGMAFALLASFLIAAVGAQTFYPTELSIGLWCAIGLLMRVSIQQSRAQCAPATVPSAVPSTEAAQMAKPSRVRWRVARLRAGAAARSGGSGAATDRLPSWPRPAQFSSAGRSRLRRWTTS